MKTLWRLAGAAVVLAGGVCGAEIPAAEASPVGHDITWQLIGPSGGGWIQSLAFDPRDKDVLYAGCDVGGIFI